MENEAPSPSHRIIIASNHRFEMILAEIKRLRESLETNQDKIADLINRFHSEGYAVSIDGIRIKKCYCTDADEIAFTSIDDTKHYRKFCDIKSVEIKKGD